MTSSQMLIPQFRIERRVRELANTISKDWKESNNTSKPPVMLCVLNGAFMFFSDLVKHMEIECEIDFVRIKSYEGRDNTQGINMIKPPEADLQDRSIYIVEDLVDSGQTMRELIQYIAQYTQDIKLVTLLDRRGSIVVHKLPHIVKHYTAFIIGGEWVIGYGLDDNKLKRNYTNIYEIPSTLEVYSAPI